MSRWTPYELSIILHYYVSPDEYPGYTGPAFPSVVDALIERDLMARNGASGRRSLRLSARGEAFVRIGLLNTRIPEQVWQMPEEIA